MPARYYLGIDVGTYESKGVLTDRNGRILADARIAHELSFPQPGWAEHDADATWWHDFVYLCHELVKQAGVSPGEIAGVGCSAIGPCVLPVDSDGHPLRPAILYGIDTRAAQEVEFLNQHLGADWLINETGTLLSSQAAGPKVLWIRRHEPEIWDRTWKIMTATSYLVFRLTGRVVIDYYTATAYGPLYNINQNVWDPKGVSPICNRDLLPDLEWSTSLAGRISEKAAGETGLAAGTPIMVGTCDAAAEAISAGVTSPGDTMLMYGSTMFFIEITDALPHGGGLWPAVFLEPNSFAVAAGMSTTGAITRWFRDNFGQPEMNAETAGGENAYAALSALASQIPPGSEGLLVLPYFSGERTPINDPLARGVIAGLTLAHSRGHVYRAILEGIAYGVRDNLEALTESGTPPKRLVAIGGGTKNRLWLQIVSDVSGQTQYVQSTPGACYGDAFLAAVGTGAFSGAEQIEAWLESPLVVEPNLEAHAAYQEFYTLYRPLYHTTRDVAHALAQLGSRSQERG